MSLNFKSYYLNVWFGFYLFNNPIRVLKSSINNLLKPLWIVFFCVLLKPGFDLRFVKFASVSWQFSRLSNQKFIQLQTCIYFGRHNMAFHFYVLVQENFSKSMIGGQFGDELRAKAKNPNNISSSMKNK